MFKVLFFYFFTFLCLYPDDSKTVTVELGKGVDLGTIAVGEACLIGVSLKDFSQTSNIRNVETSCECLSVVEHPLTFTGDRKMVLLLQVDKVTRFKYNVRLTFSDDSVKQFFIVGHSVVAENKGQQGEFSKLKGLGAPFLKGKTKVIDKSLYSFYRDVADIDNKLYENITIVDIRSKTARRDIRIPNSIVIDRHFLLSSSFLKKSSILIVGDCLVNEADQKLCKALNAAGFKSKLLFGGASALYDGGYKLDMSLKGKAGLKQLSALELFRARSYENVYFIVPEKFMAVAQYIFSNPVSGKFSKLPEYAQVISLVSEYGDQNYFQYDGGFEAYLDFLQHQRRLHSPDKVVKTTVGGKTTVKMNEECSTCP